MAQATPPNQKEDRHGSIRYRWTIRVHLDTATEKGQGRFAARPGGAAAPPHLGGGVRMCPDDPAAYKKSLAPQNASCFIANDLQLSRPQLHRRDQPVFDWVCGLLVLMVLACGILSTSPALHHLLHRDADTGSHQCAITLFAHGHLQLADNGPIVFSPLFRMCEQALRIEGSIRISQDYLLSPGRAPPRS